MGIELNRSGDATAAPPREPESVSAAGETLPCPACAGLDFAMRVRKGGIEYRRCRSCGLERRHPLPTLEQLSTYYESAYATGLYVEFVEAEKMKRATARWRLRAMARAVRLGKLLDVGCADGVFVQEASRAGYLAQGIDLSTAAVRQAEQRGIAAKVGTVESIAEGNQFDVITMFDVLEHTLAPRETLIQVARLLKVGGSVVLSVPNLRSFSRLVMGHRWYFYITDEHMHLFTSLSLSRILNSVGLEPVVVTSARKPMTFAYSLTQFEEYNPLLYRFLSPVSRVLPGIRDLIIPLPIGELLVVARKRVSPTPGAVA